MDLPFRTLDVFTDRTFGGNPLGVFPEAAHLPADLMQRVAREMNLSESVFLGPPETPDGDARVRIFTPAVEVPFAGHPTVGTAIYLAASGAALDRVGDGTYDGATASPRVPAAPGGDGVRDLGGSSHGDQVTLVLEENVGPVPVDVRFEDGAPVFAMFTTAMLPEHRPSPHTSEELAAMVGLDANDVIAEGLGPAMVSCGLPYHIVPVATLAAARRAALDTALWRRMLANSWAHHVYVVCLEAEGDGADAHVRMFAPGSGVAEDPATGSAAAALGGYLGEVDGRADGTMAWVVEQGLEIGRPSIIHVEVDRARGETVAVRVGGSATFVSEGVMTVPSHS